MRGGYGTRVYGFDISFSSSFYPGHPSALSDLQRSLDPISSSQLLNFPSVVLSPEPWPPNSGDLPSRVICTYYFASRCSVPRPRSADILPEQASVHFGRRKTHRPLRIDRGLFKLPPARTSRSSEHLLLPRLPSLGCLFVDQYVQLRFLELNPSRHCPWSSVPTSRPRPPAIARIRKLKSHTSLCTLPVRRRLDHQPPAALTSCSIIIHTSHALPPLAFFSAAAARHPRRKQSLSAQTTDTVN